MPETRKRIAIVGGGFSGAAAAVQLARRSPMPLEIVIVEPRREPGRGVAYSTLDRDHRLNAPLDNHVVDPEAPHALRRWCDETGVLARDPEALASNGNTYIRRSDFGTHVAAMVRSHAGTIAHRRAGAVDVEARDGSEEVRLDNGERIAADLVILATGNGPARLPASLRPLAGHPALVANPLGAPLIAPIERNARVLVLGSGLTALDVISTLVRRGHEGAVTAISRHGLRPYPQRPRTSDPDVAALMARIDGPPPAFAAEARSTRALLRVTREHIHMRRGTDPTWHAAFDEVRNSVWRLWPALPLEEKRRFLRHLRPWYDVFRFRSPPQNEALMQAAERRGTVAFHRGHLLGAEASGAQASVTWQGSSGTGHVATFDVIYNCTGLDPDCGANSNPLLAALTARGRLSRDPTGFGFAVDAGCRPLDATGEPQARLRMFGPPTAGTFGDPLGAVFIAPQIRRALPGMFEALAML